MNGTETATDWRTDFASPKFVVALCALLIFAWAYGKNVEDKTMVGAIIGGFNLALGFYLGSTAGAGKATENTGKLADAFKATAEAGTVTPTLTDTIREGDAVTITKEPGT